MSLVLIEGFEGITNDNAEVQKLFARKGHSCYAYDMGADTGRLGSGTCLAYPTNRYFRLHIDIASPATMIIGFAVKFAVWPNKNSKLLEVFRIAPSSWRHFALYVTSDGELYVYDAASQFHYTSGSGLQGNTWHYIELKTTIANSGTLEIRVDGNSVLSTTADMLNGTVDSIACVAFAGENATTAYWDDIYILDGTGTENNDFLGPCSIVRLDPSLDNSVDFTPSAGTTNYDKVADGSASDDDTTYVESSTLGDCDKYGFGDLGSTGVYNHVVGAQINTEVIETATSGLMINNIYDLGGGSLSLSSHSITTDWSICWDVLESVTTISDVNAALFGFETVS